MALQAMSMIALLFGAGCPLIAALVPSLRGWLLWNLFGAIVFAWPLWMIFSAESGSSLDRQLGWAITAAMTVPAAFCFLLSSAVRGYWLAKKDNHKLLAGLIPGVSFCLLACGIYLATGPSR